MELIDREKLLKELKTSADHHEENSRDYVLMLRDRNIVREQPTVEAISKDQYENRLKADMLAMLEELKLEFEEYDPKWAENDEQAVASNRTWDDFDDIIQQKIDALKADEQQGENS